MAAKHADTQPPYTYAPYQSCSFCYHPSHQDDNPFISHYVIEANKSAHESMSKPPRVGVRKLSRRFFVSQALRIRWKSTLTDLEST